MAQETPCVCVTLCVGINNISEMSKGCIETAPNATISPLPFFCIIPPPPQFSFCSHCQKFLLKEPDSATWCTPMAHVCHFCSLLS